MTHPSAMDDHEYDQWIRSLPTAEEQVSAIMRESRYVEGLFPAYSSGATDLIDFLLGDLRKEWDSRA